MLIQRYKKVWIGVLLVLIILIIALTAGTKAAAAADAACTEDRQKYFDSYVVQQGDTLWEIAGRHLSPEYPDRRDYIDEVRRTNRLEGDRIYPGQLMILPYYVSAGE